MPDTSRLPWRAVALSTVLALAASVGTYVLLSDDGGAPASKDRVQLTPGEGVSADEAHYTTFDGDLVALTSLRGTPTVVNFFSSTCTPCITEMPAFEQVHQALGSDVAFLGLAVADRPEAAQALVTRTGVTYPTAQDRDGSVITALGGTVLPTTVLLDAKGAIVASHTGKLTAAELRKLIAEKLGVPG